jgi:hypothetical protein
MDLWLSPVLCALSTSSDVLRRNVGQLVLTPLLEFYSSGLWRIMAILQDDNMFMEYVGKEYSQYKLNAFISVIRVGRKLDIIDAANYTEGKENEGCVILEIDLIRCYNQTTKPAQTPLPSPC